MKRYGLAIILSLCCSFLFSMEFENIRVHLCFPRTIPSNNIQTLILSISNRGDVAIHNLELSVTHSDDLTIVLNRSGIDTLEYGRTVRVTMEVSSNRTHFFDKNTLVMVNIANEDYESNFRYTFTITAIENFWLLIILSLAIIIIVLFIVVYIKANKGEKNAG